ncbi:MAG: PDZ domain-containing protein [Synergistaceae bacterium]|nr:PDZ domain-containing protein [Synergistaceae bacterium]
MKLKIVSMTIILCMLAVPAANAAPHPVRRPDHPPGPPPRPIFRPYHRPMHTPNFPRDAYYPRYRSYGNYRRYRSHSSNDIWISIGAGLLLGTIISNMNRDTQYSPPSEAPYSAPGRNDYYSYTDSYEREREKDQINEEIRTAAKAEAVRASQMVSEMGLEPAAEIIAKDWEKEGKRAVIDARSGLHVLRVTGFDDGGQMSYTFLPENRKVYVRISVPEYSLSAEESDSYSMTALRQVSSVESRPSLPAQNYTSAAKTLPGTGAGMQQTGFDIERSKRSSSGHMIIREVSRGTAAYYAGIRPGDVLLKVNAYDSRNFDPGWFSEYISNKYKSRSLIILSISRKGTEKRVEIQL